jgi:hypothetical protein
MAGGSYKREGIEHCLEMPGVGNGWMEGGVAVEFRKSGIPREDDHRVECGHGRIKAGWGFLSLG